MHNFGRYPRREIVMSYPVPAASSENNYAYPSTGITLPHPRAAAAPVHSCDQVNVRDVGPLLNCSAFNPQKGRCFPPLFH
ncbi:hypothetical protein V1278_005059 [Bradyrhizobium sp. AZCC 1577]